MALSTTPHLRRIGDQTHGKTLRIRRYRRSWGTTVLRAKILAETIQQWTRLLARVQESFSFALLGIGSLDSANDGFLRIGPNLPPFGFEILVASSTRRVKC